MPINAHTQRTFTRTLFAGIYETITLLKRGDDQQEGTVVSYVVYQCRRSLYTKSGEAIQGAMPVVERAVWHIPRREMDRIGVAYLNVLDRIVDGKGRYWQPESGTEIIVKLCEVEVDLQCLRIDPPGTSKNG